MDPLQSKCHAISDSPTPSLSLMPKLGCSRDCCHRNSIILRPRMKRYQDGFEAWERTRKRERVGGEEERNYKTSQFTSVHVGGERSDVKRASHAEDLHIKNVELRTWECCSTLNRRRTVETMLRKEINYTYILGCTGSLPAKVLLQLVQNARMLPSAGLSSTPHFLCHTMTSGKQTNKKTTI